MVLHQLLKYNFILNFNKSGFTQTIEEYAQALFGEGFVYKAISLEDALAIKQGKLTPSDIK